MVTARAENRKVQPRPKPKKPVRVRDVEEHVSPGGKTTYTTKPGAAAGTMRKALERARQKQGRQAPRVAKQREREQYEEEKLVVSPGGNTAYQRVVTPAQLAIWNPSGIKADVHARERKLLQMRQSKRLADARARNQAAAAGLEEDGRILLGVKLLQDALSGCLAGSSDVQRRGTLINAMVCLKTPSPEEEYYCEGLGSCLWFDDWFGYREKVAMLNAEIMKNSRLLIQLGCCSLVTEALRQFPTDIAVIHAAMSLAYFMLTEPGDLIGVQEQAALMFCQQGLCSLVVDALLQPFCEWSSTGFSSRAIFWAVVRHGDREEEVDVVDDSWGGLHTSSRAAYGCLWISHYDALYHCICNRVGFLFMSREFNIYLS